MKTKRSVRLALWAGSMACAVAALPGCELIVDFDRSKIPSGLDASLSVLDAAPPGDATATADSGGEAGPGGPEAGVDATTDAAPDAQTTSDASDARSPSDASDAGAVLPDTGSDAAAEAGVPVDAAVDGGDNG